MQRENIVFQLPSLSVNLTTLNMRPRGVYRDMHFHRAVEFVRVHKGEVVCHTKSTACTITNHDILIINSGVVHKLSSNTDAEVTYVQINIDKYVNSLSNSGAYIDRFIESTASEDFRVLPCDNELSAILDNIKKEFEKKDRFYEEYIKAHAFMLVAFLRRNCLLSDINTICDHKKVALIEPVIKYIDENFSGKLTLDELAARINISRFQLCRLFKEATGSTVFDYINFVRLYHAEEMLINSEKTVSEIAFDCGFASIQYFNRAFKAYNGFAPSIYKKQFSE